MQSKAMALADQVDQGIKKHGIINHNGAEILAYYSGQHTKHE
jgi:hypothetical protein